MTDSLFIVSERKDKTIDYGTANGIGPPLLSKARSENRTEEHIKFMVDLETKMNKDLEDQVAWACGGFVLLVSDLS